MESIVLSGNIVESNLSDAKFEIKDCDSRIYEYPEDLFTHSASKCSYSKPSSAPVRNDHQSSPVAHAQVNNAPRGTGTDKKPLNRMDVLTKTKPEGNVHDKAAAKTRLEGKGNTESRDGRRLTVANSSCRTSGFSLGQKNAADASGWRDEAHD